MRQSHGKTTLLGLLNGVGRWLQQRMETDEGYPSSPEYLAAAEGRTAEMLSLLRQSSSDIESNEQTQHCLFGAGIYGQLETVRTLLDLGVTASRGAVVYIAMRG